MIFIHKICRYHFPGIGPLIFFCEPGQQKKVRQTFNREGGNRLRVCLDVCLVVMIELKALLYYISLVLCQQLLPSNPNVRLSELFYAFYASATWHEITQLYREGEN